MTNNCNKIIMITILLALSAVYMSGAEAATEDVPFSISVEPEKMTANVGDEVTYSMRIDADEGYNESIHLVLDISALGYQVTLDVGKQDPPYPKDFEYSFTIPSEIPIDVTAEGVLTATSGSYVVQETVEMTIKKSGGAGGLLSWLVQMLSKIWNSIISIFKR